MTTIMEPWLNTLPAEAAPVGTGKPAGSSPAGTPAAGTTPALPATAGAPGHPGIPAAPAQDPIYELKAVDGSPLKGAPLEALVKAAKEQKVSPESAQKLLDAVSPVLRQTLDAQLSTAQQAKAAEWAEQSRAHPEIGGVRLTPTLRAVNSLIAQYGTPGLRTVLTGGLEYQPDLLLFLARIHGVMAEDGQGRRQPAPREAAPQAPPQERTIEQLGKTLYGSK
jgi:hypothetical protein